MYTVLHFSMIYYYCMYFIQYMALVSGVFRYKMYYYMDNLVCKHKLLLKP